MRIQCISKQYLPAAGGSEYSMHDLMRYALEYGHEVEAVVENRSRPFTNLQGVALREIGDMAEIRPQMERFNPDVVITQLNWQSHAVECARALGLFSVVCSRIGWANPGAELNVFNSRYVAETCWEALPELKEYSLVLYPTLMKDRLPSPVKRGGAILCVNPVYAKGGLILKAIAEAMPEQEFIVPVGWFDPEIEGIDLSQLGNLILVEPADGIGVFLGECYALIVPSIWNEPFGRVIIESMAAGIPVVASRIAGIPEAMGGAGILVEDYRNIHPWTHAIRRLKRNPNLWRKHRQRGLGRVKGYFKEADPKVFFQTLESKLKSFAKPRKIPDFDPQIENEMRRIFALSRKEMETAAGAVGTTKK